MRHTIIWSITKHGSERCSRSSKLLQIEIKWKKGRLVIQSSLSFSGYHAIVMWMLVNDRNTDRFSSADFPSLDEFSRDHHTLFRYWYGYFRSRPQHVINRIYTVKTSINWYRTYGASRCLGRPFTPQNHCVILWGYGDAAPKRGWVMPLQLPGHFFNLILCNKSASAEKLATEKSIAINRVMNCKNPRPGN